MPIEDRNLKPGTQLVGRYHKQSYSCEVVEGEGGKLRYRLADGREFKSPSAAGMAITGHACDGWVFWSVQTASDASTTTEVQQTETQQEPPEQNSQTPKVTAGGAGEQVQNTEQITPIFFKMEWQRAVPRGQTRWHCNTCDKHFLAPTGETPQACPQGHQAG